MELSTDEFYLQKMISEIQEILKIIKPGEDEQRYKNRLADYQKQLEIMTCRYSGG